MKLEKIPIYQSMWFKPYFEDKKDNINARNLGGWLYKRHFYMAWALSVYRLKKYYKNIILVTDSIGKQIAIDNLKLPYTEYYKDLDSNNFPTSLWATGKLLTYCMPKDEFLHFDNDVFIWKKIKDFSSKNELIIQNYEYDLNFYKSSLNEISQCFDFIPDDINKLIKCKKDIISINAGTFGCNDSDFIKSYVDLAYEFISKNLNCLNNIDTGKFNTIFEQLLCFLLAKRKGIKITPILKQYKPKFNKVDAANLYQGKIVNFYDVNKLKYIHPLGSSKKCTRTAYQLEKRLEFEFPKVYYKILELDNENKLL